MVDPPAKGDIKKTLDLKGIPSTAYLAPILEEEEETVRIEDAATLNHNLKDIKERIEEFDPDFLGISTMTPSIDSAYEVAKIAKKGKRELFRFIFITPFNHFKEVSYNVRTKSFPEYFFRSSNI
ncbi:MAG: cobalamin-dependent protein [Thermoplasmata archaeon]